MSLRVAGLLLCLVFTSSGARATADEPPRSPAQRALLEERDRLDREADQLSADGKIAEAIRRVERIVQVNREVLGPNDDATGATLAWLASLYAMHEEFEAARKAARDRLACASAQHPADDWRVANARRELADIERLARLEAGPRRLLLEAEQLLARINQLNHERRYQEALPLAEQMLKNRRQVLGDEDALTGDAYQWVGWLYRGAGDVPRAVQALRRAFEVRRQVLDRQDPRYAATLNVLGKLYVSQNDWARAAEMCRELLAVRQARRSDDPAAYATAVNNLAWVLGERAGECEEKGDFATAQKARREVVDLKTNLLGASHPDVTDARLDLADSERLQKRTPEQRAQLAQARQFSRQAGMLHRQGRAREAVASAEKALSLARHVLGEKDRFTGDTLHALAYYCSNAGEKARAVQLYEQALAIRRRILGEHHPSFLVSFYNLAVDRGELGDEAGALAAAREGVAASAADGRWQRDFLEELAGVLGKRAERSLRNDDLATAQAAREEILDVRRRLHGEGDWRVTDARWDVTLVKQLAKLTPQERRQLRGLQDLEPEAERLARRHQAREAVALAQRILDGRRRLLGEKNPVYANALAGLAQVYHLVENYAQEELWRRRVLELRRQILGGRHPQVAVSVNNLGVTYRFLNQFEKAEPLYREAVELHRDLHGAKSADYATALGNLGYVLVFEGHFEQGEAMVRRAAAILREVLGENHPDYGQALDDLGVLHRDRGDYPRALPLLTEAVAVYRRAVRGERTGSGLTARTGAHAGRCLTNLAHLYKDTGEYAKAESRYQEALALTKELFGEKHPDYATSLNNLATLYHDMGRYTQAEQVYQHALALREEVNGKKHERYATSLNNLGSLYDDLGQFARAEACYLEATAIRKAALGEKHPDYATSLNNLAMLYMHMGEYTKAEPLFQRALAIRKEVLGDKHPDYAVSLSTLAYLYHEKADYREAERLARQALTLRKQILGPLHPDYARSLGSLANIYYDRGDYARAEPLCREALAVRRKILGEKHRDYAESLLSLGKVFEARGAPGSAEKLYQQALAIQKAIGGETHPGYAEAATFLGMLYQRTGDFPRAESLLRQALEVREALAPGKQYGPYAESLNNLATLYVEIGDYAKAETFLRRALDITKRSVGENHPTYALYLTNLGLVYFDQYDRARAEPLFRQALAIKEKTLGPGHPSVGISLNQLGLLVSRQGQYARAAEYHRRALQIDEAAHGRNNPETITALSNLAYAEWQTGEEAAAEAKYREVLARRREMLGDKHPDVAWTCQNLGMFYLSRGDQAQSLQLLRQAVGIIRQHREQVAAVESERQQLATAELQATILGNYLSAMIAAGRPAEEIYPEILAAKGEVSARQLLMRRARQARTGAEAARVSQLYTELASATRRLANLTQARPADTDAAGHRRRLEELSNRVERLERDLAEVSQEFRLERSRRHPDPERLKQALPGDAALVDFLAYSHYTPPADRTGMGTWRPRLAVFVLRPGRPIERLDLGNLESIGLAVEAWRQYLGGRSRERADPGALLRRRLWEPLEKSLDGVRLVLLSPDGDLGRFPWPALPGKQPGTYLIEERAIGLVPIPQLLPDLLARKPAGAAEASLLVVGDVDFDATPGTPGRSAVARAAGRGERGGTQRNWSRLPGTAGEMHDVSAAFARRFPGGPVVALRGPYATEEAVRQEAERRRYLHLATHGFFAPLQHRPAAAGASSSATLATDLFARQEVGGFHPGLLSGLVLAGANRVAEPDHDDGILTALEVAQLGLDQVELAVLSACETGLGDVARGEGLLGLQRAFQTAGAKAVVAGLWKVPDRATQMLMTRFYQNLWEKKLPKLEALRQAQLWLLREGRKEPGLSRGLESFAEEQPGGGTADTGRLPPYYWAAFVLSGDWR